MTKKITEHEVRVAIDDGFKSLYELARLKVKGNWEKCDLSQKYNAGRGLVRMCDVAKNPSENFSRATTAAAWKQRVSDWAAKNDVPSEQAWNGYYIVQDPASVVMQKITPVFHVLKDGDMYCQIARFFSLVQKWEYGHTSQKAADRYAAQGVADALIMCSADLKKQLDIKKCNPILRPVKSFLYQIQR